MNASVLQGFSGRDLSAILLKYIEDGTERRLVVSTACLPSDSENPLPSRELEDLVQYCENEDLYLIVGCDSKLMILRGVATTAMVEGSLC